MDGSQAPAASPPPALEAAVRDPLAFLPGVSEKLGYYVYALIDPRDGAIFYVGKGKGDRVFQHARHAKKVDPAQTRAGLKLDRIREIHAEGHEVRVELVRHGLSEETAFAVEAAVTDALGLAGIELTNLVAGHGTEWGWRPLEDIVASYLATEVEIAPEHRVLLIRVSREFRHGMTAERLYQKTRQWWKLGPRRRKPEWAFAVYDGIVRAVYRIDHASWEEPPEEERVGRMKGRWAFHGARDPQMEELYVWKSVQRNHLPAGLRAPVKYVNC